MVYFYPSANAPGSKPSAQPPPYIQELDAIFNSVKVRPIINAVKAGRVYGPRGYPIKALWRAYLSSFVLNLASTNDLIRRLEDDYLLRELCGFEDQLPHRVTFNRFNHKLSNYPEVIEQCLTRLTNKLRRYFPDLGKVVAIDSTVIRSHSRPPRKRKGSKPSSDPEAGWGVSHSPQSRDKEGKEWVWGYKAHMLTDATHGIPLTTIVTPGNTNDSPMLPPVFRKAKETYRWMRPKVAIGDRGYDSSKNHDFLHKGGIAPVIHIRKPSNPTGLYDDIYAAGGVPTCLGMVPMDYVTTTNEGHHLYRCRKGGCQLLNSKQGGIRHCDTYYLQDPEENIRLFGGAIRRNSPEWKRYYGKRQHSEHAFKTLKESRRLTKHYLRGLAMVRLHTLMSTLAFQATAVVKADAGRKDEVRWQVRMVA